ncbi:phosphoenolpyruvate synthase regulatory protein [Vagococcus penaei]|uniref:Putative pyruvate, phosphate dikinase regulatory protein n=1 Tax=Vagococcus penaei TaxID=633807 RepID=A0A1Q2D3J4_9ENTE|nr:pyruvate, water dikinase regulatory protein [Vagococcus penaei]AQP52944.1 phosphoenolpyruvate synthase regulatory protein [Vagococcus penaei]RSU02598.1 phosphoenolpyruvate synthase regulatory protein [Vagococcus penaei]
MSSQLINIYIISDSAGETATKLAKAAMAQYEHSDIEFCLYRQTFVDKLDELRPALEEARTLNALVIQTLISEDLVEFSNQFCLEHHLFTLDALSPLVSELGIRTGTPPARIPGATHFLTQDYFDRMSAMEFAVKYDDGKDAKGFLEADILLLGVSRTSKTPLSLFLANKNFKVANLPLIPSAHIPKQLWEVDPKKIVGLTNDPEILNSIRKERMRAYGLNPDTAYSALETIHEELKFANELYKKLDCLVINVAQKSIEETASIILSKLHLENHNYYS